MTVSTALPPLLTGAARSLSAARSLLIISALQLLDPGRRGTGTGRPAARQPPRRRERPAGRAWRGALAAGQAERG